MRKYLTISVFFFLINVQTVFSFISPKQEGTSWTRLVKFEYDFVNQADLYEIYIYNENSCLLHEKLTSKTLTANNTKMLDWNTPYSWFVIAKKNQSKIFNSPLYTFQTSNTFDTYAKMKKNVQAIDTNAFQNGYVLVDGLRGFINSKAEIVALIPQPKDDSVNVKEYVTNMRFMKGGSIAMLRHNGFEFSIMDFFGDTVVSQVGMQYDLNQQYILSAFHHGIAEDEDGNIFVPTLYTPLDFGDLLQNTIGTEAKNMLMSTFLYKKKEWDFEHKTKKTLEILPSIMRIHLRNKETENIDLYPYVKNQVPEKFYKPDIAMLLNGGYGHLNSIDYFNKKLLIGFKEMSTVLEMNLENKKPKVTQVISGYNQDDALFHHHSVMYINDTTIVYFSNEMSRKGKGTSSIRFANIVNSKITLIDEILLEDVSPHKYSKRSDGIALLPNDHIFVSLGEHPYCLVYDLKNKKKIWDLTYENVLTKDTRSENLITQSMYSQYIPSLYPYYFSYYTNNNMVHISNEGDEKNKIILCIKDKNQVWEKTIDLKKQETVQVTIPSIFEKNETQVFLKNFFTGEIKSNINS